MKNKNMYSLPNRLKIIFVFQEVKILLIKINNLFLTQNREIKMKKLFQFLTVALMLTFFVNKVSATHVAAADLYYEYLSPLKYKVHLILYRDCKPGNAGLFNPEQITAKSASCNQNITIDVDTTGNNTRKIYGDLCPNVNNWCVDANSVFPGYEEWEYTADITLPMACTDWIFEYSLCCRNNAISNISTNVTTLNPGALSLTISAGLNNVVRAVNNSPRLTIKPIPYVCVNQPKTYLNGPVDPDLDSVFFVSQTPLNTPGVPAVWWGTSSLANPFGASAPGGYVVDPVTGTATFTPNTINTYVMAFKCFDIDPNTGDTVGYVMRDVQINVLNCNAAPPSDPNLTQNYQLLNLQGAYMSNPNPIQLTVCPGTPMSFDVKGISNSGSNLILTSANNAISCIGSTYTSNPIGGGNPVTGTFNWTPTAAQIGNHTLIIQFMDSTCTVAQPIVLKSYCVVQIKVLPGVDAGPDLNYCIGADSVQFQVTAPFGINQWSWTDINGGTTNLGLSSLTVMKPFAAPTATTTYVVTALNPPPGLTCKVKDTVTIVVHPGTLLVDAGPDQVICANDSIALAATVSIPQINPIIRWRPSTKLSDSTALNPFSSTLNTQEYFLFYRDDNGCTYRDSTTVTVSGIRAKLNALASDNNVCPNYPFQLFTNASAMPCGLSAFQCNGSPVVKTIGTGNIQQGQYSPYYTDFESAYKIQFLYTAAELRAAGIKSGNLKSIGFNVASTGSDTLRNMKISMGCTNDTALSAATGFLGGLSQVYAISKYFNNTPGWRSHVFTTASNPSIIQGEGYYWDGLTNLVVEVCYNADPFNFTTNILVSSNTPTNTVMQQALYSTNPNGCNLAASTPLIGSVRPNTRFNYCESGVFNYSWTPSASLSNSTIQDPYSVGVPSSTDFVVTVSTANPNCVTKDTVQIVVDNSNSVDATASPMVFCEPGLITLSATPFGSVPVYECGEENVNCIAPYNQYAFNTGVNTVASITPFGSNMGERTQMLYTVADLNSLGIFKGKIDAIALDVINKNSTSGYNMNIKMGCTPLNAINTFIPQQDMKLVYSNSNYNTVAGVNTFNLNTPFLWDGTQNLVVEICYFNTTFPGGSDEIAYLPGVATSQYISQFHPNSGCDLPNLPSGTLATGTSASAGTYRMNMTFSICDIPVKTWPYRWTPGTLVFDSTANTTTAYVEVGKTYHVYTTGGNKCEVHDSVTVTLSIHDLTVTPADTTICLGDGFNASAYGSGNAPSQNFVWFNAVNFSTNALSCVNCSSPVITPLSYADSLFACVRTDTYNCTDTQYVHISLNPTPTVSILNGDSITIKYLQEVNLIATGAQVYNWSPVWGTGNPNVSNTIVSPQEPTTYTVYGINQFGCGTKDSIKVNVDYEDNLFVPSAFSPNGDGINDLFKVANLSFQKIQEFRVLNRWGQEVFNANDNRGWNGTFKGVNQDPGVYYYLIKLAMPNGPTKMFKGDVTIIR